MPISYNELLALRRELEQDFTKWRTGYGSLQAARAVTDMPTGVTARLSSQYYIMAASGVVPLLILARPWWVTGGHHVTSEVFLNKIRSSLTLAWDSRAGVDTAIALTRLIRGQANSPHQATAIERLAALRALAMDPRTAILAPELEQALAEFAQLLQEGQITEGRNEMAALSKALSDLRGATDAVKAQEAAQLALQFANMGLVVPPPPLKDPWWKLPWYGFAGLAVGVGFLGWVFWRRRSLRFLQPS